MIENTKAMIFDLDGTLVDSMWLWDKIDTTYLNKLGIDKPSNLKKEITHLSFDKTAEYFKERFNIEDSVDKILETWYKMSYNEYTNNIKLKPGAKEFLEYVSSKGIKLGIATSNSMVLVETCLKSNGVFHLFDKITLTAEVSRDKRFPDVYLLAAKRLGVTPSDCIVFEDILPAICGAKSANMTVIAVDDINTPLEDKPKIIEEASIIINDYNELLKKLKI
ncbi:MAG: HAD family phosphatase [Clostridium perfringens]|nr:HAD family phosphatase [Clostridium perfringens]